MGAYGWQWILSGFALVAGLVALDNLRAWGRETGDRAVRTVAGSLRRGWRWAHRPNLGEASVVDPIRISDEARATRRTPPPDEVLGVLRDYLTLQDERLWGVREGLAAHLRDVDTARAAEAEGLAAQDEERRLTLRVSAWWASASLVLALAAGLVHPMTL